MCCVSVRACVCVCVCVCVCICVCVFKFISQELRESYEVANRERVPLITVNYPQGLITHTEHAASLCTLPGPLNSFGSTSFPLPAMSDGAVMRSGVLGGWGVLFLVIKCSLLRSFVLNSVFPDVWKKSKRPFINIDTLNDKVREVDRIAI